MSNERNLDTFSELAVPLLGSLYNFAHWLSRDPTEAEDLVQETYAKALKGFSTFQLGTNFRAWMFRILRNTWLTSKTGLAAKMTVPMEEDTPEPADEQTPESVLLDNIARETVQQAIEQLAPAYREVLLLCDVEEMSYADIAQTLDIPIGTVMSRLSRARKAVRETVQTEWRVASSGRVQSSGR
jgi:RNA polymerase sigma-70 factor (ECF subfamily)